MFEDDDVKAGDDFVVCSNCGARIKATRERCLRCFEPLHVDHSKLPVWRTLNISDQAGLLVGVLALLAVVGLVYVLWTTAGQTKPADAEAKPVETHNVLVTPPSPAGQPRPAPGGAAAAPESAPPPLQADATVPVDELNATRRSFEEKLKTNPNDPVALDGLGLTLERLGNLPEALAAFKQASEVAPRNATARVNLAGLEARLGQWDKAVVDYRVATTLSPNDYGVHYNFGLALQQTHDDAGAVTEFDIAIELAPREAAAHRARGASLERLGRGADAARAYQRYLELAPDASDAASIRERLQRLPKL